MQEFIYARTWEMICEMTEVCVAGYHSNAFITSINCKKREEMIFTNYLYDYF